MANHDKTVFDSAGTVYYSFETVPDSEETISGYAAGATLYDNEDAASQAEKETTIEKGSTLLDTYRIESYPIEGGMGKVWRVHHNGWNVDLAMKQPKAAYFLAEKHKENFIHECEAWINLGLHPHIVSCYYIREIGGIPTIFSEWMDGGSLKDIIENGSLYTGSDVEQKERILDIAIQFARGLHYAHEQGLIHQDVKPDNLLLNKNGEAKVADFGIAKARAELTVSNADANGGTILTERGGYTPAYCSIEQSRGEKLTRRTDIWSWAVSVLEMFMGDRPWESGVVAGLACEDYFGSERNTIPEGMKKLLLKCFKENEAERPHDFLAVENELLEIYKAAAGKPYLRILPKAASDTADSLNNRALSYMDLGKMEEAEKCWEKALEIDPNHTESVYNYALQLWRSSKISDVEALHRMEMARQNKPTWQSEYNLARIYLERGDGESAIPLLISALEKSGCNGDLERALERANDPDASWRVTKSFKGDRTHSVCFSHDGRYALSGSSYQELYGIRIYNQLLFWDIANENPLRSFIGHSGEIQSVCLSPDGKYALSGSKDKTLKLWDINTGECKYTFEGHTEEVHSVCFSTDGGYALSGSYDNTIKLWDIKKGKCKCTYSGHTHGVSSVCFSPDGRYILSASFDNTLKLWSANTSKSKLWDKSTGECLRTYSGHTHGVLSACFSPDGRHALSGSWNQPLILWNIDSGEPVCRYTGHTHTVDSVCFSPDGYYALSAGDNRARLWEVKTGRCLRTWDSNVVSTAVFSPCGRAALIGWIYGGLELHLLPRFDFRAGWELCRISSVSESIRNEMFFNEAIEKAEAGLAKEDIQQAVAALQEAANIPGFSSVPAYIQANNKAGRFCRTAGLRSWRLLSTYDINTETQYCSKDGIYAVVSKDYWKSHELLDIETGKYVYTFTGLSGNGNPVCTISQDGKYMLSGSKDGALKLWDIKTGECIHTSNRTMLSEKTETICLSPDRKHMLSTVKDKSFMLWDIKTGECLRTFSLDSANVWYICFNPDGRYALSTSGYPEGKLRLYDIKNGECIRIFPCHTEAGVSSACFSPDGRYVLSCGSDNTMKLWDVKTSECLRIFEGHSKPVCSACFSPDGNHILSDSWDCTMKLWSVKTGECLRTYEAGSKYEFVRFSPDGNYALTKREYRIVEYWQLNWEYEFPGWSDWDEGARQYLEIFITLHPDYTDSDFEDLVSELQNRGYGWLRPEGVRVRLKEMQPKKKWLFGWKKK